MCVCLCARPPPIYDTRLTRTHVRARTHAHARTHTDELTLEHAWKDKKREYNFDAVFGPEASQDKVRARVCVCDFERVRRRARAW